MPGNVCFLIILIKDSMEQSRENGVFALYKLNELQVRSYYFTIYNPHFSQLDEVLMAESGLVGFLTRESQGLCLSCSRGLCSLKNLYTSPHLSFK